MAAEAMITRNLSMYFLYISRPKGRIC